MWGLLVANTAAAAAFLIGFNEIDLRWMTLCLAGAWAGAVMRYAGPFVEALHTGLARLSSFSIIQLVAALMLCGLWYGLGRAAGYIFS